VLDRLDIALTYAGSAGGVCGCAACGEQWEAEPDDPDTLVVAWHGKRLCGPCAAGTELGMLLLHLEQFIGGPAGPMLRGPGLARLPIKHDRRADPPAADVRPVDVQPPDAASVEAWQAAAARAAEFAAEALAAAGPPTPPTHPRNRK